MKKHLALVAAIPAMFGTAYAAVPTSVSTAVETAGTDAATLGGLVLVAVIGIYAIKFLRRAL